MDEQPNSRSETAMPGFPAGGDNFRTVGPWRILSGGGWDRWRVSAISAEIAAARFHGDDFTATRQARILRARETAPTSRPAPPQAME